MTVKKAPNGSLNILLSLGLVRRSVSIISSAIRDNSHIKRAINQRLVEVK